MKDQYVIIDLSNMDFMKNKDGVMKLVYNHIEHE